MKSNTQYTVAVALFVAITVMMTFTPGLGVIPLNPTIYLITIHIPVVIGSIILGPLAGLILGCTLGASGYIYNLITPSPTQIIFFNPLISVFPRVMVGVVSAYAYKIISKLSKNSTVNIAVCSLLGSYTNTILVLSLIYLLEADKYAAAMGIAADAVFAILYGALTLNGTLEAIVCMLVSLAVVKAYLRWRKTA